VRLLPSMTVLENVMAGAVFGHHRSWGHAEARQGHDAARLVLGYRAGRTAGSGN
jgi:hypothetical protein